MSACRLLCSDDPPAQETLVDYNMVGKASLTNVVRLCLRLGDVIMLTFRRSKPLLSPH